LEDWSNAMTRTRTFLSILATAVVSLGLVACADEASTGDKAGAGGAPVTLRLGTEDDAGRPGAEQIQEFARQVEQLSDGRLLIEPVWDANGDQADDWDQVVARMVVSGELDMGMIPARAWDTEGVTSLSALHAPFLVTSGELVEQIVAGELAGEMLAGLDEVGVTGLALLPESFRHLFAFGEPPLEVSDFDGLLVRAPRSDTTYALFEALGALPGDFTGDDDSFDAAIQGGEPVAAESSFLLAGTLPGPLTAVGNLALFPKVNSLVINSDRHDRLTDDQRAILADAARHTVDWAIAHALGTTEGAEQFCNNGGRIVLASQTEINELERAAEPVYAELEQDAATKALIDRIRELRQDVVSEETVASCGAIAADASPDATVDASEFPEGTYRMEMTADVLMDAGIDRPTAFNHAGIWTLTFKDGQFLDPGCPGSTYSGTGDRVTIQLGPSGEGCGTAAGKVLFSARWTLEGDQLRFLDVQSGHGSDLLIETLFGGKPFTKID
jgi:TRAP-type C4-dicarboxylate transport system substrate-binding protein